MASQEHIVIFAGAGASKAVNSDRFPTTVEFFRLLPDSVLSNPIFDFVLNYLRDMKKIEIVDIEQVLWELSTLSNFFKSVISPTDIIGFAIRNDIISRLYQGQSVGHIIHASGPISEYIDSLVDDINSVVYNLYSYEPDDAELSANWSVLFDALDPATYNLDIFSTNYDAVIESSLGLAFDDARMRTIQGLKGRRRTELDLSRWTNEKNSGSLLTKLHGSIDWKLQGDQIFVGDAVFTGDHAKQAIIYPGFKGTSDSPFFTAFHNYLRRSISQGTHFIFIGFAFRDEYINGLIRDTINPDARVVVINPDKSVTFPYGRSKARYIRGNFDEKSVYEMLDLLRLNEPFPARRRLISGA